MINHSYSTYRGHIRAASPALCGRRGAALLARLGGARNIVRAWVFLDEQHLNPQTYEKLRALDPRIAVVLRLYHAAPSRAGEIIKICKAQRRALLLSANIASAPHRHVPRWMRKGKRFNGLTSMSVHTIREAERARAADVVFISPVFQTLSHPGALTLGVSGLRRLARHVGGSAYALGGINIKTVKQLRACKSVAGFAAISSLLED